MTGSICAPASSAAMAHLTGYSSENINESPGFGLYLMTVHAASCAVDPNKTPSPGSPVDGAPTATPLEPRATSNRTFATGDGLLAAAVG